MQITYLESVDSTQTYLKQKVSAKKILLPHAVVAKKQTAGLGSRNNTWIGIEGNLFLSFAVSVDTLPKDLKLESASIYFAYILKMTLKKFASKVLIKWPNDFYVEDKKIGGMITNLVGDVLVCGVGLNLVKSPDEFASLDIEISKEKILAKYFKNLEKNFLWKQIFSKFELEFYDNSFYYTDNNKDKFLLKKAKLCEDGSIQYNGERIYSRR